MSTGLALTDTLEIPDFISSEELANTNFFRRIMRKNNQFSTQFVIQSVLKKQAQHAIELKSEAEQTNRVSVKVDHEINTDREKLLDQISEEFDFKNLNFVEATKLAIRVVEKNTMYLKQLLPKQDMPESKNNLQWLIAKKEQFREALENEYERLRYKK